MKINNSSGQMTVELVMFGVLVVLGITAFTQFIERERPVEGLTLKPWNAYIAGMIENGAWGTPEETMQFHPHAMKRHGSVKGESVQ